MRNFKDGDTITIEPWRAAAFPVVKDLVVDRSAFDRIIQAGGFIIASRPARRPTRTAIPVRKEDADRAMDAAACIGCGACVAACPNGSALLFTAAKIAHLGLLPQGQPERLTARQGDGGPDGRRGLRRLHQHGECKAACPKGIPLDTIAQMNRDYLKANAK